MARTVADQMVETLAAAGVKRIYGIVGDSLNGFTDALRRHGGIQWLHVRHEEVAAFAAGADAHVTGSLAVCAGSCGPGNLHLINGLFDCHRSRVPVRRHRRAHSLARNRLGLFPGDPSGAAVPGVLELLRAGLQPRADAARDGDRGARAIGERCVSVIVIPGDVALKPAATAAAPPPAGLVPAGADRRAVRSRARPAGRSAQPGASASRCYAAAAAPARMTS